MSRFVDVNGVRLVYESHGTGDPVLLVSGIGAGGEMWTPFQVPALLSAGFRAVTFANRGVEPSAVPEGPYTIAEMATDTAGLIAHLDAGPIRVVGFSLGALIVQELALASPELVRGAALIGSLGRKDFTRRRLGESAAAALSSAKQSSAQDQVARALQLFGLETLANDKWMQAYLHGAEESVITPGLIGQQLASTAYDNRLGALAGIRVPCLVVGFELDLLTPATLGAELAQTIPGARFVEVAGCGHGGLWERPDEVNRELIAFLTGI